MCRDQYRLYSFAQPCKFVEVGNSALTQVMALLAAAVLEAHLSERVGLLWLREFSSWVGVL